MRVSGDVATKTVATFPRRHASTIAGTVGLGALPVETADGEELPACPEDGEGRAGRRLVGDHRDPGGTRDAAATRAGASAAPLTAASCSCRVAVAGW